MSDERKALVLKFLIRISGPEPGIDRMGELTLNELPTVEFFRNLEAHYEKAYPDCKTRFVPTVGFADFDADEDGDFDEDEERESEEYWSSAFAGMAVSEAAVGFSGR